MPKKTRRYIMKIDVRINSLTPGEGNVKAIASANLDDCFAVKNIRVIEGRNGLFVSMPSYKGADGEYHDLCFPTTPEMRKQLNNAATGCCIAHAQSAARTPRKQSVRVVAEAYKQAILQLQEQSNANFTQSEQMSESAPTMTM